MSRTPKFKITERKPQYNAKGHITAYMCTLYAGDVFAGVFYVPTKCPLSYQPQRTKKAQLAAILKDIPLEDYEKLLKILADSKKST